MKISLVSAHTIDINTLSAIEESVSGSHLYSPLSRDEWATELKENNVYLIMNEARVVGSIEYQMKSPEHAYISGIVIKKDEQGKGYGRAAIENLLKIIPSARVIDLVTHPENIAAKKLYESFGFVEKEHMENYFGDGEPRVRLEKSRA